MAFEHNITEADNWFIGEDKNLVFTIYQAGTTLRQIEAGTAVPQNVTGWAFEYVLRLTAASPTAVITKTTPTITLTNPLAGVVTVPIADTDTDTLAPRTYSHALRRTDAGNEVITTFGTAALRLAAGH